MLTALRIQHRMDVNRDPPQPLSESREFSPQKTRVWETPKHTWGFCYVKFYNSLLLACCRCRFPHQQWALTQNDFRVQRKLESSRIYNALGNGFQPETTTFPKFSVPVPRENTLPQSTAQRHIQQLTCPKGGNPEAPCCGKAQGT